MARQTILFKGLTVERTVRFFVVDWEIEDGPEIVEVSEFEFLTYDGLISYERNTVRENGCAQICLTKGLTS
jgi:hypothetical protein